MIPHTLTSFLVLIWTLAMEANVFRFAVLELKKRIIGLRIEKIFDPAPGAFTLDVGSAGYVIVYASPSRGFFFLSRAKPDNKQQPSGQVMWLRKRIRSRRIQDVLVDWPRRRMAWQIGQEPFLYLLFDLRKGLTLVDTLDEEFTRPVCWPTIDEVKETPGIWERYPQITPPLRHLLADISREQGEKLLVGLQSDIHDKGFWLEGKGEQARVRLWGTQDETALHFATPLEAAEAYGFPRIASMINQDREIDRLRAKKIKRCKKALKRLDQDERRLQAMIEGREFGQLLQANLYQLDSGRRMESLSLLDMLGQNVVVALNPRQTLLENMQRFFAKAKKGDRGLPIVRARREKLEDECLSLASSYDFTPVAKAPGQKDTAPKEIRIPKKYRGLAIHLYRTDDHFLLIRGKSQKANHQLLSQLAAPFDYWFHAQDGPGAHVILKRDFETQDVPRKSIEQAAVIAALASWQRGTDKARVLSALVRHVRKIKGAALGRVQVGQVEESVVVTMDPELEERLRIKEK